VRCGDGFALRLGRVFRLRSFEEDTDYGGQQVIVAKIQMTPLTPMHGRKMPAIAGSSQILTPEPKLNT
jgi:hypothetical protein